MFLAAGLAIRLLYAYPTHKYIPDADALLTAMRAFDILHGDFRVFFSHMRLGAVESYLHAAAFLVLGVSRGVVALAPLLTGVATLLAFFFFVRELLGREAAIFSLLFLALPSPAYLAWTYLPTGYPETVFFCAAALWLAARIARKGPEWWSSPLLGLAAGLGLWNSIQTLTCTLPAVLWLLWRRRPLLRDGRFLLRAGGGFLIGALPWIGFNVRYPLASFQDNFTTRPAAGVAQVLDNLGYFFSYQLPELTVGLDPYHVAPSSGLQRALVPAAAGVFLLAVLALTGVLWTARAAAERPARSSLALLWLTTATIGLLYVVSEPGQQRGFTVRYILPLYLVAAAALGLAFVWLRKRNGLLAVAAALFLIAFHFSGYYLPWTTHRRSMQEMAALDSRLARFLEQNGIRWVCGNYWVVYPLNFLTRERIVALPFLPMEDHMGYARRLSAAPSRWALVVRDPATLGAWLTAVPLEGRTVSVGPGFYVFLPSPRELARPSTEILGALQSRPPWGH